MHAINATTSDNPILFMPFFSLLTFLVQRQNPYESRRIVTRMDGMVKRISQFFFTRHPMSFPPPDVLILHCERIAPAHGYLIQQYLLETLESPFLQRFRLTLPRCGAIIMALT